MCMGCVEKGSISKFLYDVIEAHAERYPESEFGIGHIVLGDDNVQRHHIEWCLEQSDDDKHHDRETRPFLMWMLTMDDKERCPNPDAD